MHCLGSRLWLCASGRALVRQPTNQSDSEQRLTSPLLLFLFSATYLCAYNGRVGAAVASFHFVSSFVCYSTSLACKANSFHFIALFFSQFHFVIFTVHINAYIHTSIQLKLFPNSYCIFSQFIRNSIFSPLPFCLSFLFVCLIRFSLLCSISISLSFHSLCDFIFLKIGKQQTKVKCNGGERLLLAGGSTARETV